MEHTTTDLAMMLGIFAGLFFLALCAAEPLGKLIEWTVRHHQARWPTRPMTNQERKARWAARYYQGHPLTPNTHPWPWIEAHGTGASTEGNDHE